MTEASRHAVIVLAAGGSSRLGQPKQLLFHEGETLLHRAARFAFATLPAEVVVVLGADASRMVLAIADLPIRALICENWRDGMGASLRCAVQALDANIDGVMVVLCDQPALTASHLITLRDVWHRNPLHAVASGYADTVGVPALLPRHWLDEKFLRGDQGARVLLHERKSEVTVIDSPALATDIDHTADLSALR
ncbi:nucleotidyltransferase family protein [Pseudolysobacter antarcticus]|uniref:Nucleotidyltransferase family protein n=1 Tax=Pseudolysobacter antarcticus TaxID=2511995 RepID=A0A411HEV1_9GAMM|nr:nucleotidyltransferase family protein [Pseudolysobacter antarcticus]QBB69012.1 nucleotidyltransferase family protein [Pseudolysobacter antarcticus]